MLFNADIRQNFTLAEANLENKKKANQTFARKLKTWNQILR